MTPEKADTVSAPLIKECPVNLECRVTQVLPLGSHDMFIAEITAVRVRENLLDKNGKLHLESADLIAYSHGQYYELGEHIGRFGYSVRKEGGKA